MGCPSNVCCKFPLRKFIGLPFVPQNLLVLVGTSLMKEEVKYLFLKGLCFGGLNPKNISLVASGCMPTTFAMDATFGSPMLLAKWINAKLYPEKPFFCDPERRLQSWNDKACNS